MQQLTGPHHASTAASPGGALIMEPAHLAHLRFFHLIFQEDLT